MKTPIEKNPILIKILLIAFLASSYLLSTAQSVRVGIYQNSPKVFLDEKGKPQGIFVDIMNEMARCEGWSIEYVFGSWQEGIERLETSEIDILLDVTFSDERKEQFILSKIFVIDDWLEAFTLKENHISSVSDFKGKRIGVIGGSIQDDYMHFDVKENFGINYEIITYNDYPDALKSLLAGETDIFIASRFFHFSHLRDNNVWPTSVILRPSEVYFAFRKNIDSSIVATIDRYMIGFKNNPKSVYYNSLNKWLRKEPNSVVPKYVRWALITTIVLAIVLFIFTYYLKSNVAERTRELSLKNKELETLNNKLEHLIIEDEQSKKELVKFKFMVDNARQEAYLISPTGELVYTNKAVVNSLKYSYNELLEGGIKLFDPIFGQEFYNHFNQLKKEDLPEFETYHFTKDGRKLIKKVRSFYLKIVDNEYVCGFAEDITEQKKAEKSLVESQQLFQTLAQMSPIGIFRTTAEGITTYVNPKWSEISGLSFDQAMGNGWFKAIYPDDLEKIKSGWNTDLQLEVQSEAEYRFLNPDGSVRWVLGNAVPEIVDDEISGYIGTITDITDRKIAEINLQLKANEIEAQNEEYKQLNEELYIAKAKAEESDKLKSAFLANMSHEIRTPMNAICGFTNLLSRSNIDEKTKLNYIDIINSNSQQLLNIINDIIDISKIESGQITIYNSEFSINNLIDELFIAFSQSTKQKGVELICKKGLPDSRCTILSDETKIKQIFNNLIYNAIKFTNKGTIEFGYCLADNYIEFYTKDSGIGISSDFTDIIFERFMQIEDAIDDSRRGTGLGLPISKAYVEAMGGIIWVDTEEGKGSTFSFTIPFIPVGNQPQNQINKAMVKIDLTGKTILIAEDDYPNFFYLSEIINQAGAIVIRAENGVDAIEKLNANPSIELILMDIKLPRMNGLEATMEIRKFNKTIPIIAQTAYAFSTDSDMAIEAGCNAFLSKPIDDVILLETMKELLTKEEE